MNEYKYSKKEVDEIEKKAILSAEETMKQGLLQKLANLAGRHYIAGNEDRARIIKEVAKVVSDWPA